MNSPTWLNNSLTIPIRLSFFNSSTAYNCVMDISQGRLHAELRLIECSHYRTCLMSEQTPPHMYSKQRYQDAKLPLHYKSPKNFRVAFYEFSSKISLGYAGNYSNTLIMLKILCNNHAVHVLSIESYYLLPPTRCHTTMIITLNQLLIIFLILP